MPALVDAALAAEPPRDEPSAHLSKTRRTKAAAVIDRSAEVVMGTAGVVAEEEARKHSSHKKGKDAYTHTERERGERERLRKRKVCI